MSVLVVRYFFSSLSLFRIISFSSGEISSWRGLYTVGSLRCTIAFLMYSSLSSTTIVEPLSALLITMCGFFIKSLSAILSFWLDYHVYSVYICLYPTFLF